MERIGIGNTSIIDKIKRIKESRLSEFDKTMIQLSESREKYKKNKHILDSIIVIDHINLILKNDR